MAFDSGVHLHLLRGGKEINPLPEPGLMAGPEHSILVRLLREGMGGADAAPSETMRETKNVLRVHGPE